MNYLFRMEIYSYVFFILMCFLINNKLRGSRYKLCDKLVIAHYPVQCDDIFPVFLIFFYFTGLKSHEVSWQNMRNPKKYCNN